MSDYTILRRQIFYDPVLILPLLFGVGEIILNLLLGADTQEGNGEVKYLHTLMPLCK